MSDQPDSAQDQLQPAPAEVQPSREEVEAIQLRAQKERAHLNGASWFFWIAGLSLITSIISIGGGTWSFLASLGVTQVIDGVALAFKQQGMGNGVTVLAILLDVLAAAIFVVFGIFARKGKRPVYLAGLICYLLDTLIMIPFGVWLGLAFHAFALFQIWQGFAALGWLGRHPAPLPAGEGRTLQAEAQG